MEMSQCSVYDLAHACPEWKHKYQAHEIQRLHVQVQQNLKEPFPFHRCCTPSSTVGTTVFKVVILDGSKTCFAGSQIRRPALQVAGYTCSPWQTQLRDHVMGCSELQVVEQIHGQIEDIPGPQFFQFC